MSNIIKGVGKDAPIIENEKGGRQSDSPYAMHLMDPDFMVDMLDKEIKQLDPGLSYAENIANFMKTEDKIHLVYAAQSLEHMSGNVLLLAISEVLKEGEPKYKANNWRLITQEEHLNHALVHYLAWASGDTQDNHFGHCLCRTMMAYATKARSNFSYTHYMPD